MLTRQHTYTLYIYYTHIYLLVNFFLCSIILYSHLMVHHIGMYCSCTMYLFAFKLHQVENQRSKLIERLEWTDHVW